MNNLKIVLRFLQIGKIAGSLKTLMEILYEQEEKYPEFLSMTIDLLSRHRSLCRLKKEGSVSQGVFHIQENQLGNETFELIQAIEEFSSFPHFGADFPNQIQPYRSKILVLASHPVEEDVSKLDQYIMRLVSNLEEENHGEKFEIISGHAANSEELISIILHYRPEFLHFSGSCQENGIFFMEEDKKPTLVEEGKLKDCFHLFYEIIGCIFLSDCFLSWQGETIRKFIPNVIGTTLEPGGKSSMAFTSSFYKHIAEGKQISFSYEAAKLEIGVNDSQKNLHHL